MKNKEIDLINNRINQSNAFLDGEGNNWFERNKQLLSNKSSFYETSVIKQVLKNFKDNINSILEIGCSNGSKLNDLSTYFDGKGFGIDPSESAIKDGKEKYNNLNLTVSTASNLEFKDNSFDLLFFGFCLYLIDRNDIYKVIAEADRVLKSGGFLAILDFDPGIRHKNTYHHMNGLFTYKNSYADFFTSGGHYYLLAKDSFSHNKEYFDTNVNERISISILYKEPNPYDINHNEY